MVRPINGVLGSGVSGTARHSPDAGAGRGIHNHAAALAHHLRDLVLHADERAAQIDVEDAVPLVEVDLVQRRRLVLDAGIVEGAVDAAESFDGLSNRSLDLFRPRHIAGEPERFAAFRFNDGRP